MDIQTKAIELQKIFHKGYKTYWEETEAIKKFLETAEPVNVDLANIGGSFCECKDEQNIRREGVMEYCTKCELEVE